MWTAVVGGSIHRAAARISAASVQSSARAITSHRMKDRRKLFRRGFFLLGFGVAVTFQNSLSLVASDKSSSAKAIFPSRASRVVRSGLRIVVICSIAAHAGARGPARGELEHSP